MTKPNDAAAVRELVLNQIKQTWSVEDADVTSCPDGFDWLPGSHLVKVRVEGNDQSRSRITVATDFAHSVPVDKRTFVQGAVELAYMICPSFSAVYPPGNIAAKGAAQLLHFHPKRFFHATLGGRSRGLGHCADMVGTKHAPTGAGRGGNQSDGARVDREVVAPVSETGR